MDLAFSWAEQRRAAGIATPLLAPIVLRFLPPPATRRPQASRRRSPSTPTAAHPVATAATSPDLRREERRATRRETPALAPTAAPIIASPIPVGDVARETDRFRCKPYGAVLFASACLKRQEAAAQPKGPTGDYFFCRGCEDGLTVMLRLRRAPLTPPASPPR